MVLDSKRMSIDSQTAFLVAFVCVLMGCSHYGGTTSAGHIPRSSNDGRQSDNGKMIFMTGHDDAGRQIVALRAPLRPSCAACHRADGRGGVKFPNGAVSADLRHAALVTKQKTPYNTRSIERAITGGIDNVGKPLDPVMPRWKLSQRDLRDVARYVYAKLK